MKKEDQRKPNVLLKMERELHGWSQKYVADQVGADHYYLSRWERGNISPSPYYRQKLCDLFGKNARELGLLQEETSTSREASNEHQTLRTSSMDTIYDPTIPLLLQKTTALVGRDEMLFQLKERLCTTENVVFTALYGIPGVGKTALVSALVHDDTIRAHFRDGVLWAGIGPTPQVLSLLSRWGSLLGVTSADVASLISVEAWSQVLRCAIGTRRMLLVLDDVWTIETALAFLVGGPHCAYLVTTRLPHIALRFASEGATLVEELKKQESVTLLARLAPAAVKSERKAIEDLVVTVGGLPLALTLIGKYLHVQGHSGQPRRIRTALQSLHAVEARLHLSEPLALLEPPPGPQQRATVSLQAAIAVSIEQLNEQVRMAFYTLAVFSAKPNTFSEEAALAVCQMSVETLDALSDTGLLESRGPGRYTLHQTIVDYAKTQSTDRTPYERLATFFADYVEAHKRDHDTLEEESDNILAALQVAFEQKRHAELVRVVRAFLPFLQARGRYEQAEVYLKWAYQSAASLQDLPALATTLCSLGEVAEILSGLDQAETYLLGGLTIARQCGENELISHLLQLLGLVTCRQGNYAQARAYLQEGLLLARQDGNTAHMGTLLRLLGRIASDEGNYAQAEKYLQKSLTLARQGDDLLELTKVLTNLGYQISCQGEHGRAEGYWQEGLTLARQIGHRQSITLLLINLGYLAYEGGNPSEAQHYWETCLPLARQMGDWSSTAIILINLSTIASDQGEYVSAEGNLQESLNLARRSQDHLLIGSALDNWAECQLKQQHWARASVALCELQALATKGNQQNRGIALYGFARIDAAQDHFEEALQKGQESLTILETLKHFRTSEVEQWLSSLPTAKT